MISPPEKLKSRSLHFAGLLLFCVTLTACRGPAATRRAAADTGPALDAALVSAVRAGEPQQWADALREFARAAVASPDLVDMLAHLLRNPSAPTRARAAMALGALGAAASPAVPDLLATRRDADLAVRAEAVFALGATGVRSEAVLRGLFLAATRDTSSMVARATLLALNQLGRYPTIPVGPAFQEELRAALRSESPNFRSVALRTAMRADVPWARAEFSRLLSDADPNLRVDAAYALAGVVETVELRSALAPLAADTVAWVRELAGTLPARPQVSDAQACSHRAVRLERLPGLHVTAEQSSTSVRGDGRGPYIAGVAGVRASLGTAFNFFLPNAPTAPGIALRPARSEPEATARALIIDLSPVTATAHRHGVRDPAARLHVFYMRDARGVIWNLSDIPVGATVESDRTQLNFFIGGRYHALQFGPWGLGQCLEEYASGVRVGGQGTTPVTVRRLGEYDFRVSAGPAAVGRLWDVSERGVARDLGLYRASFALRFSGGSATPK